MIKNALKHAARSLGYHVARLPIDTLPEHLRTLLSVLAINCVIDVGAHFGEYGSLLRESGYRGRIVSFEPIADSFKRLSAKAGGDRNWRVKQIALGAGVEQKPINVTAFSVFTSFLAPTQYSLDEFPDASNVVRSEVVEIVTLASVFEECIEGLSSPRVYLKLDTQGYDLQVLAGAGPVLEHVAALQSEVSVKPIYEGMPSYLQTIDRLHREGFELTGLFPVTRDHEFRVIEFDCVMRRPAPRAVVSSA